MDRIKIAIAGNPNCGKTTLFNALTGSRQQVGNWPGVTVERIEGDFTHAGTRIHVTDLPGIYSFSAYSIDEQVAREHILRDKPDLVVNILDATNLERNLYLTTQLLEMRVPMVVALSMTDIARKRRIKVEAEHLARHLGCPVVPIVSTKGTGLPELKDLILKTAAEAVPANTQVQYDSELEKAIRVVALRSEAFADAREVDARWLALKLLEQDEIAADVAAEQSVAELIQEQTGRVEHHTGEDLDIVIADGRYGFIHGLARDVVHRDSERRRTFSDEIDKVLLHRVLGIPIFLGIMYLVFVVTINVGGPFIDFFDKLGGSLFVDGFGSLLISWGTPSWLVALLANGLGGGIQTISTFIPPIFLIFLCLSLLEDSGYMARAAFVMDRSLRTVGLPGKAFIPMLVGFGCNVPAILATRTLENNRDRILTILMNPFMSCGARLPVYTLFVAAFFPQHGGSVLFGLYLTGIVLAVCTGMLFKRTILAGDPSSFVMELPPYHLPTLRGIMFHTWTRLKTFMLRAGKAILAVVMVLSFFNAMGTDGGFSSQDSKDSLLSSVSRKMAPVLAPMGLREENWPGAVGLFMGLFAKEAVVGTLDTLYAQMAGSNGPLSREEAHPHLWQEVGEAFAAIPQGFADFWMKLSDPLGFSEKQDVKDTTMDAMVHHFDGKIGAIAYLLFILIYAPCVSAIAAIYRETNLNWTIFAVVYLTTLAWITSTLFYQFGTFSRHPTSSAAWIAVCVAAVLAGYLALRIRGRSLVVKT